MLNNPWILGGGPMSHISSQLHDPGSGHMVVQTQSVSIASSDGSLIQQTNTYESWVTVTGPQAMSLDVVQSTCSGQTLFNSLDMSAPTNITSRAPDTFLTLSLPSDALASTAPSLGVSVQTPFVAPNQVEPVVALPAQMSVSEPPLMAAVQNPAETFIAVPVPQACDTLVAVPTVQNLYNPLVGAPEPSVPVVQAATTPATQTSLPSWYLVVQDVPDSTVGTLGTPSVVKTDDGLYLCMRCNSTFEKASCINWHLRECGGERSKQNSLSSNSVMSTTSVEVKAVQCSLCSRLFSILHHPPDPFVCSDCSTSTVPFNFSFGTHPLRQFKCSECGDSFHSQSEVEDHQTSHQSSVTICELPDNYEDQSNGDDEGSVIVEPMVEAPEDNDESCSFSSDSSVDIEPQQSSCEPCGECGASLRRRESLEEHLKSHGEVRSYGCTKCGLICVGKYALNRHVWAHTREVEDKENMAHSCFEDYGENTKDVVITQPFGCTECGMQFSDSNDLKEHCVSHLRSKPFRCTQCGEKFETTNSLERHWEAHTFNLR